MKLLAAALTVLIVASPYLLADTQLERRVYEDTTFVITQSGTPERQYIFGPVYYVPQAPVIVCQ